MKTEYAIKAQLRALARRRKKPLTTYEMTDNLLASRVLDWVRDDFDISPFEQVRIGAETYEAGRKAAKKP